ncbi:integral membrane sensor signal transduction histidine kinase [Thermoanaerobacterium thermosaccharolyticum DSM 571]|uniref:histidine kinase n=1 Tax=Thermoanaerobacterium thermosaccharolyticum (strain ATCC 7956 / DSM 571 / NCIMB 9385 / NCA 3814 / NCTC 13789 / WDCM 00135 / 2032) TaxID=580327 RepID=D9TLT4_THETC|nr:HAMP domain-containing sensor histidine kinase [Thermoanaerobacterium thermosaccharolyticum]ADL70016.1 integral membrane sensor signal transduction histidine kinase [Thermoanaerobacterium thermosaccharolyticum DSM 571]
MKKIFRFRSLAMRIWMTFTAVILIIVCSLSMLYIFAYRRVEENNKIQDLKVSHEMLMKNENFDNPFNNFSRLKNLKGGDNFIVDFDTANRPLIIDINHREPPPDIHSPSFNSLGVKLWMSSFIKGGNMNEKLYREVYDNMEYFFIISTVNYDSSNKAYLVSYVPNIVDNTILYLVIAVGIIFIIIGFFTSIIVAGYIAKPLKKLEEYTMRIAHKDWKEPINLDREDEIGMLANSMNMMQKELKRADEEEKMFLQSISHDLKTPVMVIMSHADAIIDGVYIESLEKTAEIIKDEAIRLQKKINQMLYLNTLDYVLENNSRNDYINMRDLLTQIISRFEVIKSSIEWDLDVDDIIIKGDGDKIEVCIENILDNAIRYANELIRITLKKDNKYAVLDIYNDGPNIDEKHVGRIFDRMYKDKTGNFGLGLAISKKIVDFYKGEITAVNREKGVSFIIKYPLK